MKSVNKLRFTLDNLVYNCVVKEDEDVEIILPCRTPNKITYTSKQTKEKSIILTATNQIKIRVYFDIKTSSPKITIKGESSKTNILYSGNVQNITKGKYFMQFVTTDGGLIWYVNQQKYGDNTGGDTPVIPTDAVTSVNGKVGSTIVLDASDIKLAAPIEQGQKIVSIQEQFNNVNQKIVSMEQTITNKITGEVVKILPDMIQMQLDDTIILAPLI